MRKKLIGVDLGTINDYTAVSALEPYGIWKKGDDGVPRWRFKEYRLLYLERYLGEPYNKIIDRLIELRAIDGLEGAAVVVDATGVGRPVVDLLKERGIRPLIPVTITGGDTASTGFVNGLREHRVPKADLVGALQVLLQNGLLKVPGSIEMKDELVTEMQNFKVKLVAETGHATFEHWRSGDHDDLVLSVALAAWYADAFGDTFEPFL